jgi:hypothetical protein
VEVDVIGFALLLFSQTAKGGEHKRSDNEWEAERIADLKFMRCMLIRNHEGLLQHSLEKVESRANEANLAADYMARELGESLEPYPWEDLDDSWIAMMLLNDRYPQGEAHKVTLQLIVTERALQQYKDVLTSVTIVERQLDDFGIKVTPIRDLVPLDATEVPPLSDCLIVGGQRRRLLLPPGLLAQLQS